MQQSLKSDFSVIKIVQTSAAPLDNLGQIQLYIPAGKYSRHSRIQFGFTQATQVDQRYLVRNDCFPIRNMQVIWDGVQCMQVANLQTLQYCYFYKYLSQSNFGGQTADIASNAGPSKTSYAKTSVQVVGTHKQLGTINCSISFSIDHFFAGLFSQDSDFFEVKNQIALNFTVDPSNLVFQQVAATHTTQFLMLPVPNASTTQLQCIGLLKVPNYEIPQTLMPMKRHMIIQYAQASENASIQSYTPSGLVYQMQIGFGGNFDFQGVDANTKNILATQPQTVIGANSRVTLNGLQLIQTNPAIQYDILDQVALLEDNSVSKSNSCMALIDCQYMNQNIQIQFNPGCNVVSYAGFYEALPLEQ